MPARLSAFLVWGLVTMTAVFWGLRLLVRAPQAPVHTVSVVDATPIAADLTGLLGAAPVVVSSTPAAPQLSARFRLTGVMADRQPSGGGVALIAIDGKMPRAFRVGTPVDGELVLQSVSLRTAAIGPSRGTPAVVLELPLPVPAATGTLPSVSVQPGVAPPTVPAFTLPGAVRLPPMTRSLPPAPPAEPVFPPPGGIPLTPPPSPDRARAVE